MSWQVPGGFTCTGLGWDGTNLLIGDFTGSRIVKTDVDGNLVSSIDLAGSPANSVQGVAWDGSRSHYWVAHYATGGGSLRRYNAAGALQQTIDLSGVGVNGPNGISYDAVNDRILTNWENGTMRGIGCVSETVDEGPITLGSLGTADGIEIDPADPTLIWVSADTVPCTVAKITRATGAVVSSWKSPKSVEDVAFVDGVFYMAIDQGFHDSVTDGNRVWKFDHLTGREITGNSVLAKSISFDIATSSTNQIVTGVGFAPLAMQFISMGGSPGGATFFACYGVSDHQINQWAMTARGNDNQATSQSDRDFRAGKCFLTTNGNNTEQITGALLTPTHDGFILTVVNASALARRVHVLCLAGDDFKAQAGTMDLTTASGNQSVAGLYFQPKVNIFAHNLSGTTEGNSASALFQLGAGLSPSARWCLFTLGISAAAAADEQSSVRTDQCMTRISAALAFSMLVDFVSNDANGFTVNKATPPGVDVRVGYLSLGGNAQFALGNFNQPTSTGNQSITGVGFTPKAEIFVSDMKVASADVTVNSRVGIGFAVSSSDRRVIATTALDAADPTDTARDLDEALCALAISDGGTPTRQAQADFVSQDADGFTLNWTTADATARRMLYLAIGAGPVAGAAMRHHLRQMGA